MFEVQDHYFKKAKENDYLARSIYKLEEIDNKINLLKIGSRVLDLGYYPGSWTQYASKKVGPKGWIVSIDIQKVHPLIDSLENVRVWQKDIYTLKNLSDIEEDEKFSSIISDMAPKTTGVKLVDQSKSLELVEMVFTLLPEFLSYNGGLVVKVFESHEAQKFLKEQKGRFKNFSFLRPQSTRKQSIEFFVMATGFKA